MDPNSRTYKVVEVVEQLSVELNPGQVQVVGLSTHLEWDLGLGSIERHELLTRLERALGERLPSRGVFEATTVSDLIDLTPGASASVPHQVKPLVNGERPPHPASATDLISALLYQAEHQADRENLFFLEDGVQVEAWSYPRLVEAVQSVAGGLVSLGVKSGDRVAVMLPSGPEYLASFYGILWAGGIPVPLYPPFRMDQLEEYVKRQALIIEKSGVRCLISFEQVKPIFPLLKLYCAGLERLISVSELQGEPPPPQPHEHALIQFTSGSTGDPKGVVLSHANLLHNIRGYGYALGVRDDDVTVSWLPLYHDMGLIGTLLGSVYHGRPLVLMGPQDFLARPSRWLWALHTYLGTISAAPNFAYEICSRKIPEEELEGLDLSRWRIALNGAEAVRADTLRRFTARFEPYGFCNEAHFPAYGLAEASLAVTFPPPGRGPLVETVSREALEKRGVVGACGPGEANLELVSCGRPLPEMEVRIVDPDGRTLADGNRGLVEFRGPSAMEYYFDNPEATRKTISADGWLATGDLGYLSEGELYLTGRVKDIIIVAGRNVQAEDIEDLVAEVDGVRRGCVVAFAHTDDHEGTERLVVVAETRNRSESVRGVMGQQIERHLMRTLGIPPYKVELVASGSILKTPSGKIRRAECKARWERGKLGKSNGAMGQLRNLLLSGALSQWRRGLALPGKFIRRIWCASWLTTLIATPQVVSLVSVKAARKISGPAARLYLKMVGVGLSVKGEPSYQGPCILVVNHCSTLDALVLSAVWRSELTFLVAPWVAAHAGLRHLISRLGHIPVHRGDPEAAEIQEMLFEERLWKGETLAIFPEGGVEVTPGLRPFALGAFRLAARTGVPIIPIAFRGTREAQPLPEVLPSPVPLSVVIGEPMMAQGSEWDDVLELSNRARNWIANHCGDPLSNRRLRRND